MTYARLVIAIWKFGYGAIAVTSIKASLGRSQWLMAVASMLMLLIAI